MKTSSLKSSIPFFFGSQVTRLEGQVVRYKSAAENAEKVEDELKAEILKMEREVEFLTQKNINFNILTGFNRHTLSSFDSIVAISAGQSRRTRVEQQPPFQETRVDEVKSWHGTDSIETQQIYPPSFIQNWLITWKRVFLHSWVSLPSA